MEGATHLLYYLLPTAYRVGLGWEVILEGATQFTVLFAQLRNCATALLATHYSLVLSLLATSY